MLRYPISTLLYLAKINIKDKIQDALKLHNNIDIRLTAIIKDKDGKIIKQHKQRSHSFLMNFLAAIATPLINSYGSMSNLYVFRNTGSTWWCYAPSYTNITNMLNANDNSNDSSYGIVVGTGTAPPTPTDYNMEAIISNGTGSGKLLYGAHTISPASGIGTSNQSTQPSSGVLTPSGNTTSFSMTRTFQNQSGASITVSEVGIIAEATAYTQNTIYILIIHDLLSSPITIPNGGVMAITYTISVTT